MKVAFINENTLGHVSYLPRYIGALQRRPELGIVPFQIDASPLPPELEPRRWPIQRGVYQLGLDRGILKWREAVSRHAANQLRQLETEHPLDAVVVNTQSAGLALDPWAGKLPILVALDATFLQLSRTPWFAPWRMARWLYPWTIAPLIAQERVLYRRASAFLPWSERVGVSLMTEYGVAAENICALPPSVAANPRIASKDSGDPGVQHSEARPRLLFLGGDFRRKGGELLLDVWQRCFAERCDLDVVTQTPQPRMPVQSGLRWHMDVQAGSEKWHRLWSEASALVFPSHLETFGIVLLEALAFGVPVLTSQAGAACEILENGRHGLLLDSLNADELRKGIQSLLDDPVAARARAESGWVRWRTRYELEGNTERLAQQIQQVVKKNR